MSSRSTGRSLPRSAGAVGLAALVGYVVGTFPTAAIVTRRVSGGTIDLRAQGSGNPGTANAMKVLGTKAGLAVLAGDIGKGALACGLGGVVGGPAGAHLAGSAAVGGHCYPVWTGGKGGKGVATGVGQCMATFPAYFPVDLAVATLTAAYPALKRRAFTATAVSSACWVAGGVVWWRKGWGNAWGPRPSAMLPIAAALSSTMIIERFLHAARNPLVAEQTTSEITS